jgi:hypothetical protein
VNDASEDSKAAALSHGHLELSMKSIGEAMKMRKEESKRKAGRPRKQAAKPAEASEDEKILAEHAERMAKEWITTNQNENTQRSYASNSRSSASEKDSLRFPRHRRRWFCSKRSWLSAV